MKNKFNIIDKITIIYISIPFLLSIIFFDKVTKPWTVMISRILMIIGIYFLIKINDKYNNKVISFFRYLYPLLLYPYFFEETEFFNHIIFPEYLDKYFIAIDKSIFGYYPFIEWTKKINNKLVNELFYFFYFSYYWLITATGIRYYLYFDKRKFYDFMFRLSFVFYFCYTVYLFIPTAGPNTIFITGGKGYIMYKIMKIIYLYGEVLGSAFPSSHVAIAITILFYMNHKNKYVKYFHIFIIIGLCLSTVFCGYHYFIDMIFGIITGVIMYNISGIIFKKLKCGIE